MDFCVVVENAYLWCPIAMDFMWIARMEVMKEIIALLLS